MAPPAKSVRLLPSIVGLWVGIILGMLLTYYLIGPTWWTPEEEKEETIELATETVGSYKATITDDGLAWVCVRDIHHLFLQAPQNPRPGELYIELADKSGAEYSLWVPVDYMKRYDKGYWCYNTHTLREHIRKSFGNDIEQQGGDLSQLVLFVDIYPHLNLLKEGDKWKWNGDEEEEEERNNHEFEKNISPFLERTSCNLPNSGIVEEMWMCGGVDEDTIAAVGRVPVSSEFPS